MRPQPFKVRFLPRSEKIKATFENTEREATERLKVYDGDTKVNLMDFFAKDEAYKK